MLSSLGVLAVFALGGAFGGTDFLEASEGRAEKTPAVASKEDPKTVPGADPAAAVPAKTVREAAAEESTTEEKQQGTERLAAEEEASREEAAGNAKEERRATGQGSTAEQYTAEQEEAEQYAAERKATVDGEQRADSKPSGEAYAAEQYAAGQGAVGERSAVGEDSPSPLATAAPSSTALSLTVPEIGIQGVPVVDDASEAGLSQGAGHLPGTGFPWQGVGSNTYVAGHRLGYAGTPSDHVFYDLPSLAPGDEVVVTDADGRSYTYAVSEVFEVSPDDLSVTAPVAGRDVLTLQTCIEDFGDYWTPGPNWSARYVVRADRVA